jgi:hypothetical protein
MSHQASNLNESKEELNRTGRSSKVSELEKWLEVSSGYCLYTLKRTNSCIYNNALENDFLTEQITKSKEYQHWMNGEGPSLLSIEADPPTDAMPRPFSSFPEWFEQQYRKSNDLFVPLHPGRVLLDPCQERFLFYQKPHSASVYLQRP